MRQILTVIFFLNVLTGLSQNRIIKNVNLSGNKQTKDFVIFRELSFQNGDTINLKDWHSIKEQNEENLLNTGLFNFVTISQDSTNSDTDYLTILIVVEERWYLWPYPILEHADRNFSSFLYYHDWQMVNYGFYLEKENFRGRNEVIKAKVRLGYREQYGFYYGKPFFRNNKNNGIGYFFAYNRQHESSYTTVDNRLKYVSCDTCYLRQSYESEFYFSHRFDFYHYLNLTLGFADRKAADTLLALNPDFYKNNQSKITYLTAQISYSIDKRDIHYYPIRGYYFGISAKKYGVGLFNDLDKYAVFLDGRKFWQFSPRWTAANSIGVRKASEKLPYILNYGLGYGAYLNGFEYFVIQGSDFITFKNMVRFNILPRKVSYFPFIPLNKFNKIHYAAYVNAFFHTGYVKNYQSIPTNNNTMENTLLYSYGLGLDIVTYYDKVFRIDFSVNNFGQKGIYLHMTAPI